MRMSRVKRIGNLGAAKFCENATLVIDLKQIGCLEARPAKEDDGMVDVVFQGPGFEHTMMVDNDFASAITREWVWVKTDKPGFSLFVEKEGYVYLLHEN